MAEYSGQCQCGNISYQWQTELKLEGLTLRACDCDYCVGKKAAYFSDPDSLLAISIHAKKDIRTMTHGTKTADFYECKRCDDLVFVVSNIENRLYAVVNGRTLPQLRENSASSITFAGEPAGNRLARRKQNWIANVKIKATQD